MIKRLFRNIRYFTINKEVTSEGYQIPKFDENLFNQTDAAKKNYSGYAFLNVEPLPRLKIAKIAYLVLEKIKKCPEDSNYRMFTEEYMKYLINKCLEIKDTNELENELETDSIEDFIENLSREIPLVDEMLHDIKPWEEDGVYDSDDEDKNYLMALKPVIEDKLKPSIEYKPMRNEHKFIK